MIVQICLIVKMREIQYPITITSEAINEASASMNVKAWNSRARQAQAIPIDDD